MNLDNTQAIPCALSSVPSQPGLSGNSILTDHNPEPESLSKVTTDAFQAAAETLQSKKLVLTTISQALDQAIFSFRGSALEGLAQNIAESLARTIHKFVQVEDANMPFSSQNEGLQASIHAPTYASIASGLATQTPQTKQAIIHDTPNIGQRALAPQARPDNRIFIRLPEGHASRNHHIHAVKAALTNKLGLNGRPLKGVQHVKSGLALLPADASQATLLLEKAPEITAVLGGTVEKAEKWQNYVLDYVPRKLPAIDGTIVEITSEMALEEVKFETGVLPKRLTWTRKSLEEPGQKGSIVVSFDTPVRPFRIFGTSTLSRHINRGPRVSQCNRCWGFHDQRKCNRDIRCLQCASKDHTTCQGPPKCCNCRGPHSARDTNCPAKPIVRRGVIIYPTRAESARFRAAGDKAWKIANPEVAPHAQTINTTSQC